MLSPAMTKREAPIYKVIFLNQGQVFEMYAKQIYQSDLWGFLEVEEFVFGERTQVVVDPSEEKLKAQFEGVVRHVSLLRRRNSVHGTTGMRAAPAIRPVVHPPDRARPPPGSAHRGSRSACRTQAERGHAA